MATYADLLPLRESPAVVSRVTVAVQAAVHGLLTAATPTPDELKLAKDLAREPHESAQRLFLLVLTAPAILAKLDAPATITDTDLTTSAAAVIAGLAKAP